MLNDIEFLLKEIEKLKAISEYREKIIKGLGLKTLPKTITGFRELIENNDKKWENKIKAKIEEYEQDIKDFEEYWSKDPRKFKKEKSVDYYKLVALKELLEKE